ncbi:MAG: cyanophycinase [Gemmatimonadaceae bacterium]|jgi:cyanophycinase|nr:cyanophycinase [Gemmatimonadaceae bacterium]
MPRRRALCWSPLLVPLLLTVGHAAARAQEPPRYGPPSGTLVIVGGGNLNGSGILERFIALAGGPAKQFVIVPTAGGNRRADGTLIPYVEDSVIAPWKARGLTNVRMLHTHDPKVADTEAFAAVLRDADAVWFNGGRQWNLVDSYAKTRTFTAFHDVLARGGVIGGSSAGATIQGEYLVRGATAGPDIMMTDEPNHQQAFGFLRHSAIDQHIDARNRWEHLVPVIARFPTLLGIGLSESTAIVVRGDRFEVIGRWKVAIHDNTRVVQPWEKSWFVLGAGDVYDMAARKVVSYGAPTRPVTTGSAP